MRDLQQPFNSLIEIIILKILIHYLFHTPTIGLDMLELSFMAGLGMLEPLSGVK